MGGLREDVVPQTPKKSEVSEKTPTVSRDEGTDKVADAIVSVRFHVSGSEMHFHDDQQKLKVAIPLGDWFGQLRQLRFAGNGARREFVNDGACLVVEIQTAHNPVTGCVEQEAFLFMLPGKIGETLGKLLNTTGLR